VTPDDTRETSHSARGRNGAVTGGEVALGPGLFCGRSRRRGRGGVGGEAIGNPVTNHRGYDRGYAYNPHHHHYRHDHYDQY